MILVPIEELITATLHDDDLLSFQILDNTNAAVDISECTFGFYVVSNKNITNSGAIITATTEDGSIEILDDGTNDPSKLGRGVITLTSYLKSVLTARSYWYRLGMEEVTSIYTTVKRGVFRVLE